MLNAASSSALSEVERAEVDSLVNEVLSQVILRSAPALAALFYQAGLAVVNARHRPPAVEVVETPQCIVIMRGVRVPAALADTTGYRRACAAATEKTAARDALALRWRAPDGSGHEGTDGGGAVHDGGAGVDEHGVPHKSGQG